MTESELHLFCLQWQYWSRTRKLFGPPSRKPNLLARMQPHTVNPPPDAPMSADLAAFDLAVRAMDDSIDKLAFIAFYRQPRIAPIKQVAAELGISRKTFYKAVQRARLHAYDLSRRLKDAQASQAGEDEESVRD